MMSRIVDEQKAVVKQVIEKLQNTANVNKISFDSAPMRDDGCC